MLGSSPAVSVCVPLYQKERFVGETIRSVLDQTFHDFELVVLDNASTDGSATVVESFQDPRITLLHNDETVPGAVNFARVVAAGRAPLVKMIAADDRLHPTALEKLVAAMDDPDVVVASCRQNMIGEHGEIVYRDRSLRHPDLLGQQPHPTVLRRVVRHVANPIGALVNVLFRRSAYDAAGGIPDAPFTTLDLAMWMVMLEHGDFFGIDETLCDFRIADGSASAGHGRTGIDNQVRYIDDLIATHPEIVGVRDRAQKSLRTPLMRARHGMIVSAAGPAESPRTRLATRALGLSRPHLSSPPDDERTTAVPVQQLLRRAAQALPARPLQVALSARAVLDPRPNANDEAAVALYRAERTGRGVLPYPAYLYGMLTAARTAVAAGYDGFTVLEFGVAGGNGLRAMERHAETIERTFPLRVSVVGLDSGAGLLEATDPRDCAFSLPPGEFAMDEKALRARLRRAELVLGPVEQTVGPFMERFASGDLPPLGFVSQDLDVYTGTLANLRALPTDPSALLPRIPMYFDDLVGYPYSTEVAEWAAIRDFNAECSDRRLGHVTFLEQALGGASRFAAWPRQFFVLHVFDHPGYNARETVRNYALGLRD